MIFKVSLCILSEHFGSFWVLVFLFFIFRGSEGFITWSKENTEDLSKAVSPIWTPFETVALEQWRETQHLGTEVCLCWTPSLSSSFLPVPITVYTWSPIQTTSPPGNSLTPIWLSFYTCELRVHRSLCKYGPSSSLWYLHSKPREGQWFPDLTQQARMELARIQVSLWPTDFKSELPKKKKSELLLSVNSA